ncbi:MAG: hypothetical protein K0R18_2487 [Bacillales bacterium]|jgi:spore coat protein D|nr:hypothetical protein [Bacillales bacterium]
MHSHCPRPCMPIPGCCATNCCPPVCHPPICYVKHNQFTHVIPHIHPVNEMVMNTHVFQNQHFFPHQLQTSNNAVTQQSFYGNPYPTIRGC